MNNDPLLGRQLANFYLERILGRGGMGQVYYGRDVKLNRPVAVKVIDARLRHNPAYAKRFVHEAQTVAAWRHENIAQVYYADEADGLYFFAMEYIDGTDLGQTLSQYAIKNELMPQTEVLRVGKAIASALDYAHTKDVVHRDIKPSNVLVARDGRIVLTDFGLALDTQQGSVGEVFGTAHYIAPEQARRSSDAIPQSDLYSLGIMLYEMLTGVVPFDDPSPTSVALQHIMEPPPLPRSINPSLNEATEAVLLKALSKAPQDRYQTGQTMLDALQRALQNEKSVIPVSAAPTTPPAQPKPDLLPASRKQPAPVMLVGGCLLLVFLALLGVAGLFVAAPLRNLWQANPTPSAIQANPLPGSAVTPAITPTQNGTSGNQNPETPVAQTIAAPAPAAGGTPTVLYPNGKRFMLFYDNNSLYFLNLSNSNIPINWVAFERLNEAGAAINRFNGSRWGEFYGTSQPNRCMAIEILDSKPYLKPPECGNSNYLSLRTPVHNDSTVFWTVQEGSRQFRVLWREGGVDQEVARCEIGAGTCEVYLP